ncbi:hypothetical protein LZ575_17145 [Antarcticibacterium sp. 1MA-6-2]|nr:hypothetical protein LZ575_17145 [Antarcticibacterium sp. 1MA-6-2]
MLSQSFEERRVQKIYLALVAGKAPNKAVYNDELEGKSAVTTTTLLKEYLINGRFYSLLEVSPHTKSNSSNKKTPLDAQLTNNRRRSLW